MPSGVAADAGAAAAAGGAGVAGGGPEPASGSQAANNAARANGATGPRHRLNLAWILMNVPSSGGRLLCSPQLLRFSGLRTGRQQS